MPEYRVDLQVLVDGPNALDAEDFVTRSIRNLHHVNGVFVKDITNLTTASSDNDA